METIWVSIISFLGGSLFTSVIYMFAFVSRLTKTETTLANLCKTVDGLKTNRNVCSLHGELDKQVAKLEERIRLG